MCCYVVLSKIYSNYFILIDISPLIHQTDTYNVFRKDHAMDGGEILLCIKKVKFMLLIASTYCTKLLQLKLYSRYSHFRTGL